MSESVRLIVLDGHALNPGDLSWTGLAALGDCTVFPHTPPALIVERSRGATLLLTNKTPLDAATLAQLPTLRYVGVLATGYNVVDVTAARTRGITVANVPAYGTNSVAQHVFALVLELTQATGRHAQSVRNGTWAQNDTWCYWETPLIELAGLTLGIIGRGRIGCATGRIGEAFGMEVLYAGRADGRARLEEVFRRADVLSLHCPLTDDTRHLINPTTLAWLKPSAYLINTSRGGLIDEPALAAALYTGRLAGAGLDVLTNEPPAADHPLCSARNCLVTPHLAWATQAARARLLATAAENARAFLAGRPQNVVN